MPHPSFGRFGPALFALALFTATGSNAQQPPDSYTEQIRNATDVGVAITFLEHEREQLSIDLVRHHKNVQLNIGSQSVTHDNVNAFAAENQRKLDALASEIERRGFASAAGQYAVQTYAAAPDDPLRACAGPRDRFGPLTVVQDGSAIEFRDAAGKLSGYGVIVQANIAVVPGARDRVSPLAIIGALKGADMALSLYDSGPMATNPGAGPALCRIGVGSRLAQAPGPAGG